MLDAEIRPLGRMQDFVVRRLRASDISSSRAARDISDLSSELSGRPISLSRRQCQKIAKDFVLIAAETRVEGTPRIVGMACIVVMRLPQGIRLLLESVVVSPSFRKRGIGSAILDEAVATSRSLGAEQLSLTCRSSRQEACDLYRSHGFVVAPTEVWRKMIADAEAHDVFKQEAPFHSTSSHQHL